MADAASCSTIKVYRRRDGQEVVVNASDFDADVFAYEKPKAPRKAVSRPRKAKKGTGR